MHLKYGHITNVNKDNHVIVQLDGMDGMTTDHIPFLVQNPCYKVEPVTLNALVAVLIDDSGQEGVCLGYVNSQSETNKKAIFEGDLYVKGKVFVEESISAEQNISAGNDVSDKTGSMQTIRDVYNDHKHASSGKGVPTTNM